MDDRLLIEVLRRNLPEITEKVQTRPQSTEGKSKSKVHSYTGNEALYRPYGL